MYNIDMNKVKDIVSGITARQTIENVAFVGCGASKSELYPGKYFRSEERRVGKECRL